MTKLIKLLTIISITLFLKLQNTTAQCDLDDWTALKALYESTNGDNWLIRTGWDTMIDNQNSPPSNCNLGSLYGISLNVQQRVVYIDLDGLDNCSQTQDYFGNNLEGNLPVEIGNLTFLKKIHLSENLLQGSIPKEIGNLSFLTELNLRQNYLSGNIPTEIGNLTYLNRLDLGDNNLTGCIPKELGNLSFLKYLALYSNYLSCSLPPELGNLTLLESFQLNGNNVGGNLPSELVNLVNLNTLYLPGNNFTGSLPGWLGDLVNMQEIRLEHNQFTGYLPPELCNLTKLHRLEVSYNNLSGCYPACYDEFCTQFDSPHFNGNADISDGNNFICSWEDFCSTGCGTCDDLCGCTDPTACNYNSTATCDNGTCNYGNTACANPCSCNSIDVWPGDNNADGICNHKDLAISHLFVGETGPSRNPGGINWIAQACEDWGRPQANGHDIKHHDCDGNGNINTNDANAIITNYGKTHTMPPGIVLPPVIEYSNTDYQIHLQPIGEISAYTTPLIMDVILDSNSNTDLTVFGGFFTIDISPVSQNVNNAFMNFETISWLGVQNVDLLIESWYNESANRVEVGFTKTNGIVSTGRGLIGQLIIDLEFSNFKHSNSCENFIEFEVHEIGSFNENEDYLEIENENLIINLDSSCCEPSITIDDDTPFRNIYKSSGTIYTNDYLFVGQNQQVTYQANRITLNQGFKVKAGATFKATSANSDCTN